jgi:hypothetical protein
MLSPLSVSGIVAFGAGRVAKGMNGMIAGAAFADWLADRDSQRRSLVAVNAFAERWRLQPLMTRLERALADLPERTTGAVLDAAREFLNNTGEIGLFVNQLIAASRKDPYFRPPLAAMMSEIHAGLLLFNNPDLSISLSVTGVDMLAAKKVQAGGAG